MNRLIEFIHIRRHNLNLYKTGRADKSKKVYTVITDHEPTQTDGWKYTPANKSASGRGEWSEPIKQRNNG